MGWADVCNYALLNNVTGAWCGSYFANSESWAKVPDPPEGALPHVLRSVALLPPGLVLGRRGRRCASNGKKMELTEIPAEEWNQVVKDAEEFWDELASISPRTAKVVQAYKDYTAVMEKVGVPYRYG